MTDKLRAAAKAALDAMKLARGDHGTIMLAYPAIESWLYHRVDQRLDDAIKEVDDALAEATVKESLIAQRPWVGLTDEDKTEIKKLVTYDQFETAGEYANRVQAATESKLKDKNS
tara:strand:- start:22 stop:366 length:345 start_codon:yes stop_codon:yes gene_type:complete